jgi:hypothetical protein
MAVEPSASLITPHESGLAERMARMEQRFDHLDERLDKIDGHLATAQRHDEMACTAWRAVTALLTVAKWCLPPGGIVGAIVLLKELGLL